MFPDAVNYVLLAEDFLIFLATTCQSMVDVRSVSPVLTSGTHLLSISGNQQALTKDISTPADIAATALGLRTIIFYCFMGYISALTYYLLLLISRNEKREKVSDGGRGALTTPTYIVTCCESTAFSPRPIS